jgi:Kef-type K+ transport system membrane component KefB
VTNFDLSVLFFLQMAVILATCRVVGLIARRLGQPPVVSEMIAGVVLGPSLFGAIRPDLHGALFPRASMTIIFAVAQLGLAVYMFLVGVEFRADLIRRRVRSAASVSAAGILAPFALGSLIALFIHGGWPGDGHGDGAMFSERVRAGEAVLYMGAAMSITAFPMLARIIHERGLSGTSLGTLALASGSIDDAAAWCVLAIVLASFGGVAMIAVIAIGGGLLYALVVLLGLRPALVPLARRVERGEGMSYPMLGFVLALVMLGSWYTDRIGIYAVFGAFILGTAMPRGKFAEELQRLMMPLTTSLLLPLFFVYSGLNTKIGLVNTPYLWGVSLVVLAAACLGKGVACWLAARLNGEPSGEAVAIGALMNARGLMELIILNIGYERGIITQTLFSIMVMMAIVTTLMATPIFELVYGRRGRVMGTVGAVRTT